ncbi:MAG: glycosyltransferase family 87 protein [Candidatus Limnocylindrales bacterium]
MSLLRRYAKPIGVGLIVAGYLFAAYLFFVTAPMIGTFGFDAFAYWNVTMPDPYEIPHGSLGSYNYSPAFAQVADLFSAVDLWVFLWVWTCLLVGSVIYLAGSPGWILVAFGVPFVALELYHGNIHILLAVAIVLGFRHPWTWAFVLLTKPSSGIGLLWFVVRREWRPLAIALGATAVVVAVSFLLSPSTWFGWVELLIDGVGIAPASNNFMIPLWLRLPAAAALVIWGARTDRRWTVVVSAMLALPVLWFAAPAMLIGVLPDVREHRRRRQATERAEAEERARASRVA